MRVYRSMTVGLVLTGMALLAVAPRGRAAPPGGVALVLGATIHPVADSLSVPHPQSPDDLVHTAAGPGHYDIWFFFLSRRPLVGAWTLDLAFEFDHRPGRGIDIESWTCLADRFTAWPGWPDAGPGQGIRLEWNRPDCFDETHADLLAARDGWFRQPALRIRVAVHDPDALDLADPEPGVPAQVVQCFDDAFRLDGKDGWTRYLRPEFQWDASKPGEAPAGRATTIMPTSWSEIKVRFEDSGRRP